MNKAVKYAMDTGIVVVRCATTVGVAMMAALQVDPVFRQTGHVSESTQGAVLVVGGMALLGFIDRSVAHLQQPHGNEPTVLTTLASPVIANNSGDTNASANTTAN